MKKALIAAIITLGIIASIGYVSYANRPVPPPPVSHVYTPEELLVEANKLRAEKGVAPLKLDPRLNQSAQWKADDMAQYDYFDHVRDGYHGYQKAGELSPDCYIASENIEQQDKNAMRTPYIQWVTSPPHYAAIVDPESTITGFGIALTKNNRVNYVQHFCKPKN